MTGAQGTADAGGPDHRRAALHRPPSGDLGLMALAVAAVSTSGPLIAATAAPALAIAFWRNAMASGVLVPATLLRRRTEVAALSRREWRLALVAGVFLAAHFATWVPSLTFTPVASATALVATQPIWQALIARVQGHHVPTRAWVGICLAVVGAGWLSGVDLSISTRHLVGDGLAFAAGGFAAVYVAVGGAVRRSVSTTTYTTVCYGATSVILLAVCLVTGASLGGYPAAAWWKLVALTAGAQLLGHSVFNTVLRSTSPTVVSLGVLFEVPGATVIAAFWLHQVPRLQALPAAALVIAGIAVVITSGGRRVPVVPGG